jgi:hypothetical protein
MLFSHTKLTPNSTPLILLSFSVRFLFGVLMRCFVVPGTGDDPVTSCFSDTQRGARFA